MRGIEQVNDLEESAREIIGIAEGTRIHMVSEGRILDGTGLLKLEDDATVEIMGFCKDEERERRRKGVQRIRERVSQKENIQEKVRLKRSS